MGKILDNIRARRDARRARRTARRTEKAQRLGTFKEQLNQFGKNVYGLMPWERTNQANRDMAEYAYEMDLKQWNRENEYNTPSNVYDRLEGSGFNPVAAMGGAIGATQSANSPSYQAPRQDYPLEAMSLPLEILGAFQKLNMNSAQVDNVKAVTRRTQAEADIKEIIARLDAIGEPGQRDIRRTINKHGALAKQGELTMKAYDGTAYQADVQQKVAQADKTSIEAEILRNQIPLAKMGIFKGDPLGVRIVGLIADELGVTPNEAVKWLVQRLKRAK